jgi:enoyl-CoA hydratase/carnithine racemase
VALVEYRREGRIAQIRLNRPEKLNALTDGLVVELRDALVRLDEDEDAWIGIVAGEGRAFCTGADVRQRQLRPREELARLGGPQSRTARLQDVLYNMVNWKPVFAAVHGYAMGAGLNLALECDWSVADRSSQFRVIETSRGLHGNRLWSVMKEKGAGPFADEIVMADRMFSAGEARAAGLINAVCDDGEHVDACVAFAETVLANPPLGVRALVRMRRWRLDQVQRETAMQMEGHRLYLTEDFHESALAFAEKRKPKAFVGR